MAYILVKYPIFPLIVTVVSFQSKASGVFAHGDLIFPLASEGWLGVATSYHWNTSSTYQPINVKDIVNSLSRISGAQALKKYEFTVALIPKEYPKVYLWGMESSKRKKIIQEAKWSADTPEERQRVQKFCIGFDPVETDDLMTFKRRKVNSFVQLQNFIDECTVIFEVHRL